MQAFVGLRPPPSTVVDASCTTREREVLELVARGLSNREAARKLVVEESTIRSHIRRILTKLRLRDRVQLVIFACETGVNRPAAASGRPREVFHLDPDVLN